MTVSINTAPHRFGLGVSPAVAPVAVSVAKNTYSFLSRLFGPKPLVWGLKPEEFEDRHDNPRIFRALWNSGYWARDGASEIPSGLTTQDYYIRRFNATPMWGDSEEILSKFRKGGTPLSSLRMTSIPPGMPWPPADIGTVSEEALMRVLPLAAPAGAAPLVADLGGVLPLLLLVAVGLFIVLRR